MEERAFFYHQWTNDDLKRHFDVDFKDGLTQKRARFRLLEDGNNSLENLKDISVFTIFLRQFYNIFILLLFVAAIISYFVDGLFQAAILISIILLNVFLGFFQEFKAQKALEALKETFKSESKVLRDGKIRTIPSEELVVGDMVVLDTGDRVPADLRVVESESLSVNESALTGESLPVGKFAGVLELNTALADRTNMLFGSTVVVQGRAKGVVVGIGQKTEFGKVADLVQGATLEKTPLEKQILYLGKVLSIISIIIAAIIFALGYMRGFEVWSLLTLTIALLVAAVPESLPTVITLSMAIGVSRMAKRKAIVRKLAVVETLGTVNIIATDKTGTLTNNELVVDRAVVMKNSSELLELDMNETNPNKETLELFIKGVVCSNVSLKDENGDILGDPLEVAIVSAAKNFRKGLIAKSKLYKRELEIPFDSEHKFMSVTVNQNGKKEIIAKGSAEKIISFCNIPAKAKRTILSKASEMSKEGLKVIALSCKQINNNGSNTLNGMDFVGLFALVDEPAEGISEAIKEAISAGIRPIMITGDHPETARFIAEKIGLSVSDEEIMTGKELETLSEASLKKHLQKVKVFARITPEDKINIVKLLQKIGYSVAVTGDGINDAPALKEAHVGIAMGIKGTDVAKDSADIILSDDKFGTIISAVEYGRAIYDNIRNAIIFLLSGNIDELFLIGFAFLFDLPIPLLTIQILWINMITDSLPAIALAFEKPSPTVLKERPRSIKTNSMARPILYSLYLALLLFIIGLILYMWELQFSVEKARTIVFTFSVYSELAFCFSIRSPERIWQNLRGFFTNRFLIVALIIPAVLQLVIFIKPLANAFSIVSLNIKEIIVLVFATILAFLFAEVTRYYFDKKTAKLEKSEA
ncbi:MAG: cation-translocating P-type ATPase [Patescibacteria group bacterium]